MRCLRSKATRTDQAAILLSCFFYSFLAQLAMEDFGSNFLDDVDSDGAGLLASLQ